MSRIILLNGCGSSGKTSICKSIQHLSKTPWLRIGVDTIIDMMPEQYIAFGDRSKQGYFSFTENSTPQKKVISIDTSELGKQLFMLLPKFTKMLADTGHDVIVDEVFYKHSSIDSYRLELARHQLTYVGVYCDLDILNERELLRGDRAIGLANDQFSKVHDDNYPYDLKVDSSHSSSFELAREILEYVTPALKSNEC